MSTNRFGRKKTRPTPRTDAVNPPYDFVPRGHAEMLEEECQKAMEVLTVVARREAQQAQALAGAVTALEEIARGVDAPNIVAGRVLAGIERGKADGAG